MSDLCDYLEWRGDISFAELGMCEADYVVFCSISYLPFDEFFTEKPDRKARLKSIITKMDTPGRVYMHKGDDRFVEALKDSPRFNDLKLCDFVNKIDKEKEEQFCAMTFLLPSGDMVVVFRGTDGTLVGWKEDFNMGFMTELPAQKDAAEYLEKAAYRHRKGNIYVCGHSKGGNLAMYASFFGSAAVQNRIAAVRNMDGPGFLDKVLEKNGPKRVLDRTVTYMPQSSVIGMLLTHREQTHVIHSTNFAIAQHTMLSWELRRGGLVLDKGITDSSQVIDSAIKGWIREMPAEERGKLIEGFYTIAAETDADTLQDLATGKNTLAMIKAMGKLDGETKELFRTAYKIMRESVKTVRHEPDRGEGL